MTTTFDTANFLSRAADARRLSRDATNPRVRAIYRGFAAYYEQLALIPNARSLQSTAWEQPLVDTVAGAALPACDRTR